MAKSIPGIILWRIIGFVIFLILLYIGSWAIERYHISFIAGAISFLVSAIPFLLLITFIGIVNDIFWFFRFPYNCVAPITASIIGILILKFIEMIYQSINNSVKIPLSIPFESLYAWVFWIILVIGYILIFVRKGLPKHKIVEEKKEEEKPEKEIKKIREERVKIKGKAVIRKEVGWKDVGNEFRTLLLNFANLFNKIFEIKPKKKKKRSFK